MKLILQAIKSLIRKCEVGLKGLAATVAELDERFKAYQGEVSAKHETLQSEVKTVSDRVKTIEDKPSVFTILETTAPDGTLTYSILNYDTFCNEWSKTTTLKDSKNRYYRLYRYNSNFYGKMDVYFLLIDTEDNALKKCVFRVRIGDGTVTYTEEVLMEDVDSESSVFWAAIEYGSPPSGGEICWYCDKTLAEIVAAHKAGMVVRATDQGTYYDLRYLEEGDDYAIAYFTGQPRDGSPGIDAFEIYNFGDGDGVSMRERKVLATLDDIPEGTGGATPDFNAAPGEQGHILNRTHYTEQVDVMLIPEQDTVFSIVDEFWYVEVVVNPEEGKQYVVVLNGTQYDVIATSLDGLTALGNLSIANDMIGANYPDTGEPFLLLTTEHEGFVLGFDNSVSISVKMPGEKVHKINSKYLPIFFLEETLTWPDTVKSLAESTDTSIMDGIKGISTDILDMLWRGGSVRVKITEITSSNCAVVYITDWAYVSGKVTMRGKLGECECVFTETIDWTPPTT